MGRTLMAVSLTTTIVLTCHLVSGLASDSSGGQAAPECQFACKSGLGCWMEGGVITRGFCGGFLFVCCKGNAAVNVTHANESMNETVGEPSLIQAKSDQRQSSEGGDLAPLPNVPLGVVKNDPACGLPRIASRRIVGGTDAGFGRYPWQALVRVGASRCGGALVSPRHVVTAGHCVSQATATRVRVTLGEYSLYGFHPPLPRREVGVADIHTHPYYRFTPQADRFDVAVLTLDRPVLYEPHIIPICLPPKDSELAEGEPAMVSGWGAMKADSTQRPSVLQAVEVRIVNSTKCEMWHAKNGIQVRIFDEMMCAGYEAGGKDACQGDSGGPLMLHDIDSDRWQLVGVVSAGYSCAKPGQPGIYHKVSKTSDWISHIIAQAENAVRRRRTLEEV